MNVRELKDNENNVFSPKVSADSVYLSGQDTTLTSKLSSVDTSISNKMDKVTLATVATSGSYNDLNNKPSLASVATSGSYNDLRDKPSASSANWLNKNDSLTYGAHGLQFFDHSDSAGTSISNCNPTSDWYQTIRMNHSNSAGYFVDFSICFHSDIAAFRRIAAGNGYGWRYLVHSDSPGGNIYASGFYVSSLRSLKENIEPTKVNATDLINSQEIVDFNYKADVDKARKIGLIADDSDPLFLDKKGETVDLYNTCGILMKAVQELSAKVKGLTEKVDSLTSR